ncbi:hypothetical protein L2E82_50482 [Cichorium intybus]|nr:hypothetical protein L2E82_50482 [Cichorium intybus]
MNSLADMHKQAASKAGAPVPPLSMEEIFLFSLLTFRSTPVKWIYGKASSRHQQNERGVVRTFKLRAILARFERKHHEHMVKEGKRGLTKENGMKDLLDFSLIGEAKGIETLRNLTKLLDVKGVDDVQASYMGGLFVMFEFKCKNVAYEFFIEVEAIWSAWLKKLSR